MGTLIALLMIVLAKWQIVYYEESGYIIEASRWKKALKFLWWVLGLAVVIDTLQANQIFF